MSPYLLRMIDSYLNDRNIIFNYQKVEVTSEVPQGSKIGSLLWNILYDPMGFADDLALVIVGKTEEEVKEKANASILVINSWMRRKKLVLAPPKTDIVVMSGRRKLRPVSVIVEGVVVEQKPRAKYLGV